MFLTTSTVTHIPFSKAEKVKIAEGNASADPASSVGIVKVEDEKGFPPIEIDRQVLNDVIRGRLEEAFEPVKWKDCPRVL